MAARVATFVRAEKELLANVSTSCGTPLARIRVVLELASDGDPSRVQRYLSEIAQDLAELEQLVDDVLTAARLTSPRARAAPPVPVRFQEIDPRDLIEGPRPLRHPLPGSHPHVHGARRAVAPALRSGHGAARDRQPPRQRRQVLSYDEVQLTTRMDDRSL